MESYFKTKFEAHAWETFQRFMQQLDDALCEGEWPAIAQVAATLTQATMTAELQNEVATIVAEMPSAGRGI